jgi:hypothetical protein
LPQFAAGTSPAGDWVRVYTCAQGETDLDMHIVTQPGGIAAIFHFFADPANLDVPEGCFTMQGRFDAPDGEIVLTPAAWRLQPPGYVPVAMDGKLNEAGNILSGRISDTPGCSTFIMMRPRISPTRPSSCRP